MIFQDIVALAKAGWTPKQIKEILEMVETSPKVQETKAEEVDKQLQDKTEDKKPEVEPKAESEEDPVAIFAKLLKEE